MTSVTIATPPAPAVAPNAATVETKPTITGGVQVVEQPAAPATAPAETPKLAGKFADAKALEQAYIELEKKLGAPKAPEAPATPATTAIENAGLDLNAIAEEFTSKAGVLTEATITALKAKGLTVDNVKTYVDGQTALGKQVRAEFAEIAGGEAEMASAIEWAKSGLSKEEAQAYNDAVNNGNQTVAKMLWQNIVNKYQTANGTDPKLVSGSTIPGAQGVKTFANYDQVVVAMSDPRYATDEAYRQEVAKRIGASNF